MIPLTPIFSASAEAPAAIVNRQVETLADAGAVTGSKSAAGAQDVATLDLAFKENPNDAKVRLAIKLAEQDPAMALLHIDLVNSEGGLQPHQIDKLAALAADAKDELVWQAYRASVENDLAFNDANRLQPMTIMTPKPEPAPYPAPVFKPAPAPIIAPSAPSPFTIPG